MKNKFSTCITVVSCFIALAAIASAKEELPKGWFHAGSKPDAYQMTVDRSIAHGGHASAIVKSIVEDPKGFGTLMQTFKADNYRGKRIRMSGYVRSKDVEDWAGLWMRVDGPLSSQTKSPELLAFDNMQKRAVKGTTDWTKYEIVLDVSKRAQDIAFGILLTGTGQVWLDDIQFEVVGKDVSTTGDNVQEGEIVPSAPVNLDFED